MTIDSSDALVAELAQTKILEPVELEEVRRVMLPECSDARSMAQNLVAQSRLTPYQAEQLLEGQGQGLFLGAYRILEPLGEGGMGQVFKAEQRRLNRIVALKVIHQECLAHGPEAVLRFQREALAAAKLSHPNVIAIYDAGQEGDTHFLVMEYVEGMDLARLVDRYGPLPIRSACSFICQAALGLQHAHERGMIHRDIKPSNLLITRSPLAASEQPASPDSTRELVEAGLLKILDMGLARLTRTMDQHSESHLTEDGKLVGTPDYIAPEQARSSRLADGRADIYSLGCTFYHLLAGRAPFPTGTLIEKLLMHQLDEPQPVEQIRTDVPPSIAAVVRKMLAKRPEDRYQAPRDVFDALGPFSGPSAPPSSSAAGLSPAGLSNVIPVVASPAGPVDAPPKSPKPSHAWVNSWVGLKAAEQKAPSPEVSTARELARIDAHKGCVMALAFAPDRNTLASAGLDETVRIWDFSRGEGRHRATSPTLGEEISTLLFASDQKLLAAGTTTGRVWLWDLTGPEPEAMAIVKGHRLVVTSLAFSAEGRSLVSGSKDRNVILWDLEGRELKHRVTLQGQHGEVTAVAFAPDSKRIAAGTQQGMVSLWAPRRLWNREQASVRVAPCAVSSVAFAPDGQLLACGCLDQSLHLIEPNEEELQERTLSATSQGAVRLVQFHPGGRTLDTLEDGGRKSVWEIASGAPLQAWITPFAYVCSHALTFDGRYLATGSSEGKVVVYRVAPKQPRS
jgi:eukaryotic-like serine/threonine-protein kinase